MRIRVEVDFFEIRVAQLIQRFLTDAGLGDRRLENLTDRSALRAPVTRVAPGDHIGRDPALPVRRSGQRNERPLVGDEILDFDGVADGKDIGVAGPHVFIDANASALTNLDPGHFRQCRFRAYTDGEDHDVRRMRFAGTGQDFERAISDCLELGHPVIEFQPNAVLDHVALNESCHFRIERRHDLIEPLDQRYFQSAMNQILHHLQTDETTADHHGTFRFRHRLVAGVRVHSRWDKLNRDPATPASSWRRARF